MKAKEETLYIKRILNGETELFSFFLDRYSRPIYSLVVQIVSSPQDAEEIVQDVFIKIWEIRAELSIHTSLSAYLVRMVRNMSFNQLKAHQMKTVSIGDLEVELELHKLGLNSTFDEELFSSPLEIALRQGIEQLPPQCKQIFVLNRLEGYTPQEISEQLQLSLGAVKSQIHRALQKMNEINQNF